MAELPKESFQPEGISQSAEAATRLLQLHMYIVRSATWIPHRRDQDWLYVYGEVSGP